MKKTNNSKVNVFYMWYHHMALSHEDREYIYQVIAHHDYDEFIRIRNELKQFEDDECVFLPRYALVVDVNAKEPEWVDITKKSNFFRIRDNECECG